MYAFLEFVLVGKALGRRLVTLVGSSRGDLGPLGRLGVATGQVKRMNDINVMCYGDAIYANVVIAFGLSMSWRVRMPTAC